MFIYIFSLHYLIDVAYLFHQKISIKYSSNILGRIVLVLHNGECKRIKNIVTCEVDTVSHW